MSSPKSNSDGQADDSDVPTELLGSTQSSSMTTASVSGLSHHLLRLAEKISSPLAQKTNDVVVSLDVYYHEERIKIRFQMAVEVAMTFTKSQLYAILSNIISNNLWTDCLVVTDQRFYALRVNVESIHANGLEVVLNNDDSELYDSK